VEKELRKLLDAKIIFQVRHSSWVENLIAVRKKTRKFHLCVDFHNLNNAFEKDKYHVPPMDQILYLLSGSKMFSLLDGFLRYN
jgi:hypothetical protein